MATETSNLRVQVDLKQAIADFELFDKRVTESRDAVAKLEAQLLELEKQQKAVDPKDLNRIKDYNEAIDKTKQRIKEEKSDLKQLNLERTKAKKKVTELKKEKGDLNKATGLLDRATGGLVSSYNNMTEAVGGAIRSLGKFKVALIATGIGAFIVLLGSLYAAFTRSEEGQNKFTKLMMQIGNVVNNVMDIIADLGSSVINLGKGLFKLATGDLKGASKAFTDMATDVVSATTAVKNFGETVKEESKIINKIAEIADARAKADKIERKLLIDRAKATRDVNELREKAARREDFTAEQRIEFLKEAGRIEKDITDKQQQAAQLRLDAKIQENALGKTTKEDLDEVAKLEADLINIRAKSLRRQKAISAEITTNIREQLKEQREQVKDFVYLPGVGFVKKSELEEIKQNSESVLSVLEEFKKRREDDEAENELQRLQLEEQRTLDELDRLNATEEQKMQIKKFYSDKYAEIDADNKKKEEARDKMVAQAKIATAGQVFALVGQIAKKGSKVGKIAAIGQTVISGIQAVQNAYTTAQTSPITAVNPGYPLQQAIIAGAFSAAQLAKIIATNPESPAAAGGLRPSGGGGEPAVPQFNIVGATPTSQLATAIGEQEQQPVQAYVVSQDVTTAQSLENNIITGATLGG
jgi:predicted  nucleic acid-binding Zn-ribbon protein